MLNLVKTRAGRFNFERRENMFTPNTPIDDKENVLPEWHEPFPEPQTIPCGWDLSAVLSTSTSEAAEETEVKVKA